MDLLCKALASFINMVSIRFKRNTLQFKISLSPLQNQLAGSWGCSPHP